MKMIFNAMRLSRSPMERCCGHKKKRKKKEGGKGRKGDGTVVDLQADGLVGLNQGRLPTELLVWISGDPGVPGGPSRGKNQR